MSPLLSRVLVVVVLSITLSCAPKRGLVVDLDALASQQTLAETPGRGQALESLKLASMAIEADDRTLAESALRRAASLMGSQRGEGEFTSMVGAEHSKEWKGEPYERMAAFFTLGNVLYASGDRDNALAMYMSAIFADTGTEDEAYRSDFAAAWVLQTLVFQAEGEGENATRTMERAVDAIWAREVSAALDDALVALQAPGSNATPDRRARQALLAALPAGVTAAPRDPERAIQVERGPPRRAAEDRTGPRGARPGGASRGRADGPHPTGQPDVCPSGRRSRAGSPALRPSGRR